MAQKDALLTKVMIANVSPEMKAAAKQCAKEDRVSPSEFMRRCLEAEFKRRRLDWTKVEVSEDGE